MYWRLLSKGLRRASIICRQSFSTSLFLVDYLDLLSGLGQSNIYQKRTTLGYFHSKLNIDTKNGEIPYHSLVPQLVLP